jgi:steroid 5-alpha reductase family enzyme
MLAAGVAAVCAGMALVWLIARRIRNNGIVDIAWAASFTLLVAVYAWLGHAGPTSAKAWLLGPMVVAWSLRLTVYLYRRVMGHHPVEDTRYQDLRQAWANNLDLRFFVFFQAQALAAVAFSLPHAIVLANAEPGLGLLEWMGAALWLTGFAGESIADRQLARFKQDPANRGRVCEVGLWRYSRHPNYFFEWLVWCGFALFALGSPGGWVGMASPAMMLFTLLRVTGIPATEAAAVARRGEAYRAYQRRVSAFVPWFRRT